MSQMAIKEAISTIKNPAHVKASYLARALDMSVEALAMQDKLKSWIKSYKENPEPILMDKDQIIALLEEFEV